MVTISCGRAASTRRSAQQQRSTSLGAFMPKRFSSKSGVHQRRTTVVKPQQQRTFRSNYRVPVTENMKPTGQWTAKLQVSDATTVAHTTRIQPRVQVRVQVKPEVKRNSRPCAYCKEDGCHIRTCDKLAAKKSRKAAEKKAVKKSFKDGAADRLAARIRQAQEEKRRQEELSKQQEAEDSDSSDGDFFSSSEEEVDDEDFPALPIVAKVSKRVSFKDDSENLMKPPCDTKVYNTEDAPSAISDEEEEEEIVLKSSANAWKPRRQRNGMTTHERQLILDQIKEKEIELASYSVDSWADACEIEELEEDIKNLNAKLALVHSSIPRYYQGINMIFYIKSKKDKNK